MELSDYLHGFRYIYNAKSGWGKFVENSKEFIQ